jgi:hypothetical protein
MSMFAALFHATKASQLYGLMFLSDAKRMRTRKHRSACWSTISKSLNADARKQWQNREECSAWERSQLNRPMGHSDFPQRLFRCVETISDPMVMSMWFVIDMSIM